MTNKNKLDQIEILVDRLKELENRKQLLFAVDVSTGEVTIIRRYRSEVKELAEYEEDYVKEQIKKLVIEDFNTKKWKISKLYRVEYYLNSFIGK